VREPYGKLDNKTGPTPSPDKSYEYASSRPIVPRQEVCVAAKFVVGRIDNSLLNGYNDSCFLALDVVNCYIGTVIQLYVGLMFGISGGPA